MATTLSRFICGFTRLLRSSSIRFAFGFHQKMCQANFVFKTKTSQVLLVQSQGSLLAFITSSCTAQVQVECTCKSKRTSKDRHSALLPGAHTHMCPIQMQLAAWTKRWRRYMPLKGGRQVHNPWRISHYSFRKYLGKSRSIVNARIKEGILNLSIEILSMFLIILLKE